MKIVQSFWSHGSSLLTGHFGWHHAQYHLMGWALSCLRLKEYYDDVHLYTDSAGHKILIDYLGLPYKEVHISFNELHYHHALFALPKILTYAAQTEPFLHVDGDVFIWKKFDQHLEAAPLVAQNAETGTGYYQGMMNKIKEELHYLPTPLKRVLESQTIAAYNAGVIGGNDILFFKNYTQQALELINNNYAPPAPHPPSPNFNILFEQILFHTIAANENKQVTCLFNDVFDDNGYSVKNMGDFAGIPHTTSYIHLIGPHKKNKETCDLMSRMLFKYYPEYFFKIISLFKECHVRFHKYIQPLFKPATPLNGKERKHKKAQPVYYRTRSLLALAENSGQPNLQKTMAKLVSHSNSRLIQEIFLYEKHVAGLLRKWNKLSGEYLYAFETAFINNTSFFQLPEVSQLECLIQKNPHAAIIETPFDWTTDLKALYKRNLEITVEAPVTVTIACVPTLFFNGRAEVVIDDLCYNILALLHTPVPFKQLLNELEVCFTKEDVINNRRSYYDLILLKLRHLYYSRLVLPGVAVLNSN